MIRSIPTVASYLPHLQKDYFQTSATAAVSTSHTISLASLSAGTGAAATSGPVFRRSSPTAASITVELDSAATTVRKFYDGINRRDLASMEDLIALNCVYEDLIFSHPFSGRKAILDFFKQFSDSISGDLQFAIDDISEEDTSAVGVTWHLEWKGKPFPFSRGCSFYRLDVINGQRQIVFGRDAVEPAIKPGETALVVIRGVTWLLQSFPFLGERL
ncbi:uncharacterized protein LOC121780650 isoform X2 [Salvia splendens]|uniref:uncharacterized protein LOC121780650 isoform X2 n=1 Tax=Salvia splendens TaxID=180675 RepID=UPI001C280D2E|nr:uncharacterized protein LOC121780650 isoform X2 [Salvia splendens]